MLPPQERRPLRARRRHPERGRRRPFPAHLSLQASHRRGWGSLYAALDRGRIDEAALRKLLARHPLAGAIVGEPHPSTPWTLACGIAATRSAAPSAATTIIFL